MNGSYVDLRRELEAVERAKRYLERYTFQHPLFGAIRTPRFTISGTSQIRLVAHVESRVPDREHREGKPVDLEFVESLDGYSIALTEMGSNMEIHPFLERWLYSVLLNALRHELDEMLLKDGKRVRDPHANEMG